MLKSALAEANANIALIKYWGKRNERLNLPVNSSISMTLDNKLKTVTSVSFSRLYKKDELVLDGKKQSGEKLLRVSKHLDIIRNIAKTKLKARVVSQNSFPAGTGIASSASGFAALTAAACEALGLNLSSQQLSETARLGSGSAVRSFYNGFVEWRKGNKKDGSDSIAVHFKNKDYWPELRDIIAITSQKEKKVSSRKGMQLTVKTSRMYKRRILRVENVLKALKKAIDKKDREIFFQIIMADSDNMHSCMLDTRLRLDYLNETSHKIKNAIIGFNQNITEAAYSFDAGPNAHIITTTNEVGNIKKILRKIKGIKKIIISRVGDGVKARNTSESVVKAYGKVLVYGGYGILENGTGLVVNIDKGTTTKASFNDKNKIITPGISNQRFAEAAVETARSCLKSSRTLRIESVNDNEMNPGKIKAGFGSSATATVSIIAAILDLHGVDIESKQGRKLVYKLSQKAHNKVQGNIGSGFDISTACFGTQFFSRKKIEKTQWPKNWKAVLAFTGKSANTRELVRKVHDFKRKNRKEYGRIMNEYNKLNLKTKNKENIEKSQKLRKLLGEKAKADIETDAHTRLLNELKQKGAYFAVLPGAGGGDSILAVCLNEKDRKNVINYLKNKRMKVFENVNIADKPYEVIE